MKGSGPDSVALTLPRALPRSDVRLLGRRRNTGPRLTALAVSTTNEAVPVFTKVGVMRGWSTSRRIYGDNGPHSTRVPTWPRGDGIGGASPLDAINRMRGLRNGWNGAGSLAPTLRAINELWSAQGSLAPNSRVSPAADGSILIEWESGDREYMVSIEFDNTILFVEEEFGGKLVAEREQAYSPERLTSALAAGRNA
ncbi:hypothetical protein B0I12_002203 [Microbacterium hydrothermale]|uniref:hypothetical protein n=1 Tax=Microbacterium hydrothermale TaxID=857427 RepID=UPI0022280B31|nr:hypothetical protein [Microbacterium hydrothermale]MCW2165048.1 hypothetical protein [Microbacterium hydrothermale]